MVTQKYVKSRKVYKLTFVVPSPQLPEGVEVESLALLGSFNGWDEWANLMEPNKKGDYRTIVEVKSPGEYQYRYLLNGTIWLNDWDADRYETNVHGSDNSVVNVRPAE